VVHVVLNIEALLREPRQQGAGREGIAAALEEKYSGFAGMIVDLATELLAEPGGVSIVDHVRPLTAGDVGQTIEKTHDDVPHDKDESQQCDTFEPAFAFVSLCHRFLPSLFREPIVEEEKVQETGV
jgi:hypothetical protein